MHRRCHIQIKHGKQAYDHVEWEFVVYILGRFGFVEKYQEIAISVSGCLVYGPLDAQCNAKNRKTLIPVAPILCFRREGPFKNVSHLPPPQSR